MASITNPPITTSGSKKASDHKTWLEGVVAEIQALQGFAVAMHGGGDGVYAGDPNGLNNLKTVAQGTPSMKVEVKDGWGAYSLRPFKLSTSPSDFVSATLTAPSTNPRIDVVSIDPEDGTITITTGTEAASPSAPATPAGHLKLAEIYHRTAETVIKDTDDSTNGYITPKRNMANAGGQE